MEVIYEFLCEMLWESKKVSFYFRSSNDRSAKILTIWNTDLVHAGYSICINLILVIVVEKWKSIERMAVENVYTPCDNGGKRDLLNHLVNTIFANKILKRCACGDYLSFNEFIDVVGLIYFPLIEHHFSWKYLHGSSTSKLNIINYMRTDVYLDHVVSYMH